MPANSNEVQMGPKAPVAEKGVFRHPLREQINLKHPAVRLAELINREQLGASMSANFVSGKGRPATSPVEQQAAEWQAGSASIRPQNQEGHRRKLKRRKEYQPVEDEQTRVG